MVRHPHTIYTTGSGAPTFIDGVYSAATETDTLLSVCRLEINSSGSRITLEDGQLVMYRAVVYLPATATVQLGQYVKVMEGSTVLVQGPVLGVDVNQQNRRLWV